MRRFLIINLLFLLASCSSLPDLESFTEKENSASEFAINPYFSNPKISHLYKTNISVYGKKLSGVCVLKKINDTLRRAAFLSDFGATLLDVEFGKSYKNVNYVIKKLDKKLIINMLVEDFRLLTREKRKTVKTYQNEQTDLLKTKRENGFVYYFYDRKTQHLKKLVKTSKRKKKVSIYFDNFKNDQPQKIQISHHRLQLEIALSVLNQTHVDR